MAAVTAIASIASLGYGIYAGNKAQEEQKREYDKARTDAQQAEANQKQMLADQQQKSDSLAAQQAQQQKDAQSAQQKLQQDAISTAQGQIPQNQKALSDSLIASEQQAQSVMNPALEARLNALGLLNSGALPAQQAIQQANLDSQRQQALTQYGVNANTDIQNQALGYAGTDAGYLQNNLNTTLNNEQSNLQNQFNNQMTAYQNQVAQGQYLGSLQSDISAGDQSQANQFINLGGQIGTAGLNYYGKQNPSTAPASPSSPATSYFTPNSNSTGYTSGGAPFSTAAPTSYGMFDQYGNYVPNASAVSYINKSGGI